MIGKYIKCQENTERRQEQLHQILKETRGQLQLASYGGKLPLPSMGLSQYRVLWAWLFIVLRWVVKPIGEPVISCLFSR
jgi:hypothetical protein